MTGHITHGGTAIAERLDTLTDFTNACSTVSTGDSVPAPTSTVEELATALLLQHQLSQPEICYPASDSAWDKSAEDPPNSDRPDNDSQIDDTDLPDEPPF